MTEPFWSPTPVVGYRQWWADPKTGMLRSVFTGYEWVEGRNGPAVFGRTFFSIIDDILTRGGSVWSFRDLPPSVRVGFHALNCYHPGEAWYPVTPGVVAVSGRVDLTGLVREYEDGYRAEYAAIIGPLWIVNGWHPIVAHRIARRYRVNVWHPARKQYR